MSDAVRRGQSEAPPQQSADASRLSEGLNCHRRRRLFFPKGHDMFCLHPKRGGGSGPRPGRFRSGCGRLQPLRDRHQIRLLTASTWRVPPVEPFVWSVTSIPGSTRCAADSTWGSACCSHSNLCDCLHRWRALSYALNWSIFKKNPVTCKLLKSWRHMTQSKPLIARKVTDITVALLVPLFSYEPHQKVYLALYLLFWGIASSSLYLKTLRYV